MYGIRVHGQNNMNTNSVHTSVPWDEYQMDHIKPRHLFKRPAEADVMANLQVLHKFPCHEAKTKQDLCAVAA
jgi:hypothetical protein